MQRYTFILILLLAIPYIYIYRFYISKLHIPTALKLSYLLPIAIFVGIYLYMTFIATPEWLAGSHIGWIIAAFFFLVIPQAIFMLFSWPDQVFAIKSMPFTKVSLITALVCLGCTIYATLYGKHRFEIKQATYTSSRLPKSFDGYRIVQLSDIHLGSWQQYPEKLQEAVNIVNAQQPDLIVFTGDLVNARSAELNGLEHILSQLNAPDGVYSVLGNHDYGNYFQWENIRQKAENLHELQERQANMGWKLLNNEHVYIYRSADSIVLAGVENWGKPPFNGRGNLQKALHGTGSDFKILLSHNPTHWHAEILPLSDTDLTLSGHTHAMQLKIGRYSPSSKFYNEWQGMYFENGRALYVNVGLGTVGMPFRLGAWPEITVLTLKKK